MSAPRASAVVVGGDAAFANGIAEALNVPAHSLEAEALDGCAERLARRISPHGITWLHLVPSAPAGADPFAEAKLLLSSAQAAGRIADEEGVPVTFVAVLPAPGVFGDSTGLACDLATAAMTTLMRRQIGFWSSAGRRISGVAYAGVEGDGANGQRPMEEIRQRSPMRKSATFDDLANAVRFLGSERATYVTGVLLAVDGGAAAYSWVYPTRSI